MDKRLEADMISTYHSTPEVQMVIQISAIRTVHQQVTAIEAAIPKYYWLAVTASVLPRLKSITLLNIRFFPTFV